MSNIIHMETDLVADVVRRLDRIAADMGGTAAQLQRAQNQLGHAWRGGFATVTFSQNMQGVLRRLDESRTQLQHLSQLLEAERQQWLEADRHFGEGTSAASAQTGVVGAAGQGTQQEVPGLEQITQVCNAKPESERAHCRELWSRPPENAEELAYLTMSLTEDMPFAIMDLGNGEYLVMLRGTTKWAFGEGTDWDQNLFAFLGISNLYQTAVVEALKKLPKGAKIHLAGHSQGGMVAQNLAVDPRLKKYQIETVTMFGAPTTLGRINHETKYVSYEAVGDVVPKLDEMLLPSQIRILTEWKERYMQKRVIWKHWEAWNPMPQVSHGVYDDPGVLSKEDLPFKSPNKWAGAHPGHRVTGVKETIEATVVGIFRKAKSVAGKLHRGI